MNFKITKQVKRKPKRFSKVLPKVMIVLAVLFVLLGILFDSGYMLAAFCLAVLYYVYVIQSDKEYEYILENGILTIDVIKGKRRRKTAHTLDMKDMEVIAPNWHQAVAKYRKDGGTEHLPKYDYTSYDDDIPYYTLIGWEEQKKIKLLLDLGGEMLETLKRTYPQKVYTQ